MNGYIIVKSIPCMLKNMAFVLVPNDKIFINKIRENIVYCDFIFNDQSYEITFDAKYTNPKYYRLEIEKESLLSDNRMVNL